ncbi:MAG: hypothetical protein AAF721_24390 [Myxococcota bacterium]
MLAPVRNAAPRSPRRYALALALAACGGSDGSVNATTAVPPGLGPGTTSGTAGPGSSSTAAPSTTGGDSAGNTADPDGSGTAGSVFDVAMGTTTAGDCVPSSAQETICDEIDDDCNGLVDDVDEAMDGICDCLAIAIVGVPGPNAASQFEQWLIDRGTSTERIDPAVVGVETLQPYDIIILDQLTRTYTPAEAGAFDLWVNAGGGLMAMTGHTADPTVAQQWPNSILGSFGLSYQGALLSGPVTDFIPHPTVAGLTSVTFLGGFEVGQSMAGASDVVGQLPGAVPVAQAGEFGSGKVFVWGDEWIEYDSEWSAMPEITMLWANILSWLSPTNFCSPPEG